MEILTYSELLKNAESLTDFDVKNYIRALNGPYFNEELKKAIYSTETDLQATIIANRLTYTPHNEEKETERRHRQAKRIKDLYDTLPNLPRNQYTGLTDDLKAFIVGATDDILGTLIQTKSLPDNIERPVWTNKRGSKANAWRFAEWAGFTPSEFNRCFAGTSIAYNDKCSPLQGSITDILDRYPQPK